MQAVREWVLNFWHNQRLLSRYRTFHDRWSRCCNCTWKIIISSPHLFSLNRKCVTGNDLSTENRDVSVTGSFGLECFLPTRTRLLCTLDCGRVKCCNYNQIKVSTKERVWKPLPHPRFRTRNLISYHFQPLHMGGYIFLWTMTHGSIVVMLYCCLDWMQ